MRALTWQGKRSVSVETVPDPVIQEPTDAIIKVTSTAICGSDLHLYEVLGPFLKKGDILGHETMGIVMEVGAEVTNIKVGDRVVIPFNISCGSCWMCSRGLYAHCETTQVTATGKGAALFGYTELYGSVPGGQAEYLRVPRHSSDRSRCLTASATRDTFTSPTSCPRPGRPSTGPTSRRTEASRCSGSDRWDS